MKVFMNSWYEVGLTLDFIHQLSLNYSWRSIGPCMYIYFNFSFLCNWAEWRTEASCCWCSLPIFTICNGMHWGGSSAYWFEVTLDEGMYFIVACLIFIFSICLKNLVWVMVTFPFEVIISKILKILLSVTVWDMLNNWICFWKHWIGKLAQKGIQILSDYRMRTLGLSIYEW